jgi:hypothetical protein
MLNYVVYSTHEKVVHSLENTLTDYVILYILSWQFKGPVS